MKKNKLIFLLVSFIFINFHCQNLWADDEGYFSRDAQGWYWHDLEKKRSQDDDANNSPQGSAEPTVQMDAIRQRIKNAEDNLVLHPTKENAKTYINIQNQVTENANKVKNVWKAALLDNPALDYSLKHPTNNIAKRVEYDQLQEKENLVIRELAKKSGLFFFYKSSCPYCVRFAPILKDFAESYGITVIPITLDGVPLPEFPNSYPDRGQATKFKVTVTPALFAVNPYTQKAFPVAYGLVSEADLKTRIYDIATRFGGAV